MTRLATFLALMLGPFSSAETLEIKLLSMPGGMHKGKKVSIPIERFCIKDGKKHPVVILIPESKSLNAVGKTYRAVASKIAQDGYLVFLVDFLWRTGHEKIGAPAQNEINEKTFRAWLKTIHDVVPLALKDERAKGKKVGLLGFSLGAFLGLSLPVEHPDLPIGAVVELFGGLPNELWPKAIKLKKYPPTLVVHGFDDEIVSVKEAYSLRSLFEEKKIPHKVSLIKTTHLFGRELKALAEFLKKGKLDLASLIFKAPNVARSYTQTRVHFAKYLK